MNLFPLNLARVEVSRVQCPAAFILTFWSEDGWTYNGSYYLFSGQVVRPNRVDWSQAEKDLTAWLSNSYGEEI